jgi:threonine/homoserine/homoserine lactone efflux protein
MVCRPCPYWTADESSTGRRSQATTTDSSSNSAHPSRGCRSGVGALVARSPLVLAVLTAVGATYLVWLGIGMLAHPAGPLARAEEPARSRLRQAAKGAGISGLNPKVFLLFLALLPQFTDPDAAWPIAGQIVVLGLVHVASCAVVYAGVGTGARRVLRARPTAVRVMTRFSGTAMIVIGGVLLAEQLVS